MAAAALAVAASAAAVAAIAMCLECVCVCNLAQTAVAHNKHASSLAALMPGTPARSGPQQQVLSL